MSSVVNIHMVEPWKFGTQFNSHTPRSKTLHCFLLPLPHPVMALVGMTRAVSAENQCYEVRQKRNQPRILGKGKKQVRDKQGNSGILEVMEGSAPQGSLLNQIFKDAEFCSEFRDVESRKVTSEGGDLTTSWSRDGNRSPAGMA